MEKIKVNMSPNPLDVQTIHASQNDSEAREWEFELHNNGDVIDASEISDQLVFKAYKGGTEQLLPENGSTPTTSPFKGDIRYPQGLLADQEFLYRQSPTEEDGNAKITDIKGNTLVWNQLVEKGNMTDGWTFSNSTGSYANNILTFTASAQGGFVRPNNPQNIVADHKYLAMVDVKGTSAFTSAINFTSRNLISANITADWQTFSLIFTNTTTERNYFPRIYDNRASGWNTVQIRNCMIFDLTQMGLDSITSVSEFTSLFPLSYYSYNQGSLLSFMGNGIKTVGKNRLNYDVWKTVETRNGTSVWENNGVTITATGNDAYTLYGASSFPVNARVPVRVGESITLSWESDDNVNGDVYIFPNGGSAGFVQINNRYGKSLSYTPVDGVEYVTIRFGVASSGNTIHYKNIMIRFADTDSTFEPYTSSTLSLPISAYFPNGMKSAGNVYDELTPNKAITRLKKVTYSNSTGWTTRTTGSGWNLFEITPSDIKHVGTPPSETIKNNRFNWGRGLTDNNTIRQVNQIISIRKDDITSLSDWNTYLASNPLEVIYQLATPTETSFTTASLVTENAEIPLSNEDGVLIGKCTEQLSSESGFFDAKIKLADEDGECYSNKIQLHIERSPQ